MRLRSETCQFKIVADKIFYAALFLRFVQAEVSCSGPSGEVGDIQGLVNSERNTVLAFLRY